MKRIVVFSGKGGVGKSSITASIALMLSKKKKIVAVDCDVDASNLGIVLGIKKLKNETEISTNYKAQIDYEKCNNCGKCKEVCTFSAIDWEEKPVINQFRCEGCGACKLVCPENAIHLKKVKNAVIGEAETKYGFNLITAQLKIGESGSGKVVDKIKEIASSKERELMICDSAAGIGCPVIASLRDADYGIAVTEPTPSALSDVKRAIKIANNFGVEVGLIINKWDINKEFSEKIQEFANENNIELIEKIPYDKKFVESLVKMKPIVSEDNSYEKLFEKISDKILEKIKI